MPSRPFYQLFIDGFVGGMEPVDDSTDPKAVLWPILGALRSLSVRVSFFLTLMTSYLLFSALASIILGAPFGIVFAIASYKWKWVLWAFIGFSSILFSFLTSAVIFLWRVSPDVVYSFSFSVLASFAKFLWVWQKDVGLKMQVSSRPGYSGFFRMIRPVGNMVLSVLNYWRALRLARDTKVLGGFNIPIPLESVVIRGAENPLGQDDEPMESYFKMMQLCSVNVDIWGDLPAESHPAAVWVAAFARLIVLMRLSTLDLILSPFVMVGVLILIICQRVVGNVAHGWSRILHFFRFLLAVSLLSVLTPTPLLDLYGFVTRKYFVWPVANLVISLLNPWNYIHAWYIGKLFVAASFIFLRSCVRYKAPSKTKGYKTRTRFQARFNGLWTAVQQVISDVNLPSFVRTASLPFNEEGLRATLDKLREIGWPVNVAVTNFRDDEFKQMFPDWAVAGLDFNQTIKKVKLYVDESLKDFEADSSLEYRRTEEYASYVNELKATSRYFQEKDYKFIDLAVDEVWELLSPIFERSRLAAFDTIIKRWEKSYGLAPWAKVHKKDGTDRKLKRSEAIRQLGTENFYKLWQETFFWAPSLVPIAPVSIKREALPPKKWQNDKVRTVIGAPLTHYITSTVWNYYPNHNFKYLTTPIKVGLPLNGAGMGTVFARHSHFDVHYAGDCSEFDSTLSGKVVEIIKEVRKRGFRAHKDYPRIAELIDREYVNISSQLLATTTQGNVWRKGTGLSTGHSSTSMDNSIGMVVLYLMAWKQVTRLSAKDFKHFVELSVYGDDHLISWRRDAPSTWTWQNIQHAMASWGVTNRLEAHGDLSELEFLSKYGQRPSSEMKAELSAAGISVPDWCVFHNRAKLVGKIKAKLTSRDLPYQATRLRSYLLLTAHHRDIYDSLVAAIRQKVEKIRTTQPTYKLEIPTYEEILRKWYDASTKMSDPDTEIEEWEKEASVAKIVTYGSITFIDVITNFLGRIVDVVNPEIYNSSLTSFLMMPLKPYLVWPLRFLREANMVHTDRHLEAIISKSGYDFLNGEVLIPQGTHSPTATSRLCKHWLYCMFRSSRSKFAFQKFLWVDKKLADIKYLVFGHVDMSIRRLNVPMFNMVLAAAIGSLPDFEAPDYRKIPYLPEILSLNIGVVTDALFAAAINRLAFSLPANFSAVGNSLPNMTVGKPMLIEAPTGSGKTTALIERLWSLIRKQRPSVKRVVVVEPRAAIVEGVVPYMKKMYQLSVTGYTSNMKGDINSDVAYVTPMEIVLHPEWVTEETLFVVDECHVEEPLHSFIRDWLVSKPVPVILTTATPTQDQINSCQLAPVKTVADWEIQEYTAQHFLEDPAFSRVKAVYESSAGYAPSMISYYHFVVTYINGSNPYSKFLIFVNTIKEQESLAALLKGGTDRSGGHSHVVMIRSGMTDVPSNAGVIISTSVSDVGVTIPAVDVVITTNTVLEVRANKQTGKNEPVTYTAPTSLLKQRRGRTGRTNNGTFITWNITGLPEWRPVNAYEKVSALLSSGFKVAELYDMAPALLREAIGKGVDVRAFIDSMEVAEDLRLKEVRNWVTSGPSTATGAGVNTLNFSVAATDLQLKYEIPDFFGPWNTPDGLVVSSAVRWNVSNELVSAFTALAHWAEKGVFLSSGSAYGEEETAGEHLVAFWADQQISAPLLGNPPEKKTDSLGEQIDVAKKNLSNLEAEYSSALAEEIYYGLMASSDDRVASARTWHGRMKRQMMVNDFITWVENDADRDDLKQWRRIQAVYKKKGRSVEETLGDKYTRLQLNMLFQSFMDDMMDNANRSDSD